MFAVAKAAMVWSVAMTLLGCSGSQGNVALATLLPICVESGVGSDVPIEMGRRIQVCFVASLQVCRG